MATPQNLTNGNLDPACFSLLPTEDSEGPIMAALMPAGDAYHESEFPRDHAPTPPSHTSLASETGVPSMPPQGDDVALLQRVAGQDRQAFDILYARYVPRLRHYLAHRLNDAALAEDVCQDVMLVVWQQAGRVPATVPLWAWLCGIARHKAHKAWARTSHRALASAEPVDSQVAAPDVLLLRQEAGRVLDQALDILPFYERTALRLLVQQGCSYPDIAAVMDTPLSTVRTRLWRACHRLRAHVVAVDAAPPRSRLSRRSAGSARRRVPQQLTPGQ
jgi:RNA polymerase sigma factor (sigma-70 family)